MQDKSEIGMDLLQTLYGSGKATPAEESINPLENETMPAIAFRPAKMGFLRGTEEQRNEVLSTPEELDEASQIVRKIDNVARFGYQIPAYSVARTVEASKKGVGEFAALVFPGTQNDTGSIWGNMDWIKEQWGKDVEQKFPNIDFSSWFLELFKFTGVGKFGQLYHDNEQRITILRDKLKNPQGQVSLLGMPAIDTQFYGYPPYTATSGRPSKSLTFINFNDPDSRELYESSLLKHKTPLRLKMLFTLYFFLPMSQKI